MEKNYLNNINVIGFDADDTLWVNETYFREAEDRFCKLLTDYETENQIRKEIFKAQISNLEIYGYGVKGFTLSMIECAQKISNNQLAPRIVSEILAIGKDMLTKPVVLLPEVKKTLEALQNNFRLLLITKGDLKDQERKLSDSGLTEYFHHVEILSEKNPEDYLKLLKHLSIEPINFLMVGNSLKSDVLPLYEIGSKAIHIPFHTTWAHELVDNISTNSYLRLDNISQLVDK
ncbi:MAG: HAD family hydrolase, partial [Bdellovibrionales bacterium]